MEKWCKGTGQWGYDRLVPRSQGACVSKVLGRLESSRSGSLYEHCLKR